MSWEKKRLTDSLPPLPNNDKLVAKYEDISRKLDDYYYVYNGGDPDVLFEGYTSQEVMASNHTTPGKNSDFLKISTSAEFISDALIQVFLTPKKVVTGQEHRC